MASVVTSREIFFTRLSSKFDAIQISCAAQTKNSTFATRMAMIDLRSNSPPRSTVLTSSVKSAVLGRQGGFSFANPWESRRQSTTFSCDSHQLNQGVRSGMTVASPKGGDDRLRGYCEFAIGISVFVLICLDRVTMFALRLKSWSFVGWLVVGVAGIVLTLWPHIQVDFSGVSDPLSPFPASIVITNGGALPPDQVSIFIRPCSVVSRDGRGPLIGQSACTSWFQRDVGGNTLVP